MVLIEVAEIATRYFQDSAGLGDSGDKFFGNERGCLFFIFIMELRKVIIGGEDRCFQVIVTAADQVE